MSDTGSDVILQRMMALHPKVIDLTLDRVWRLLDALGNPQNDLPPVIHIAGTNGKGSTQAFLRAGLEAAGHRVHAYTSPHLVRFHERIRLAGDLVEEEALTAFLDECYAANAGAPITYFEITTVAALLAFARTPADYTLLEVGLGGRLDATNVVERPAATVITPVSMDHEAFLGDTLAKIASEKAGILKRGVPAIIARQSEDALDVIEARAARLGAPLHVHGQQWHVARDRDRLVFHDETGLLDLPLPALLGAHQVSNAGTALATLRALGIAPDSYEGAMRNVSWPGRLERLTDGALTQHAPGAEMWLDGGHNPDAGHALAAALAEMPIRPTHLICGMLNTKDASGFLAPLASRAESLTALSIPGQDSTISDADLANIARAMGLEARSVASLEAGLSRIHDLSPGARILFCGSLYFAGHVLGRHYEKF